MPKGSPIYNPDVQSDIDMKNTWKLINYPVSSNILSVDKTIYVDAVNGSSGGQRGTTAAFQTLAQAVAVVQAGDVIEVRSNLTYSGLVTISVSGVTVDCRNHIITCASQTDTAKLNIGAIGVTIKNLEINGTWDHSSSGTTTGSAINVAYPSAKLENIYVHDTMDNAFSVNGDWSNSVFTKLRSDWCKQSGFYANSQNAIINSASEFGPITTTNCILGKGIAIARGGAETNKVNFVNAHDLEYDNINPSGSNEGMYIHGLSNFHITNVRGRRNSFNLSLDTCDRGTLSDIITHGGRSDQYCGLELASCYIIDVSDSIFDGTDIDGSTTTPTGTNNAGIQSSNLNNLSNYGRFTFTNVQSFGWAAGFNIQGANGHWVNFNGGYWSGYGAGIQVDGVDHVHITGQAIVECTATTGTAATPISFRAEVGTYTDYSVIDCNLNSSSSAESDISLFSAVSGGILDNIRIIGNTKLDTNSHSGGTLKQLTANGGVITNLRIIGNLPSDQWLNDAPGGKLVFTPSSTGYYRIISSTLGAAQGKIHISTSKEDWDVAFSIPYSDTPIVTESGGMIAHGQTQVVTDVKVGSTYPNIESIDLNIGTANIPVTVSFSEGSSFSAVPYILYSPTHNPTVPDTSAIISLSSTGTYGTFELKTNKGSASGYASLDVSGKVPAAQLPTLSAGTIASTSLPLKGDGSGNAVAVTATGSGDDVLATSPTLITPTIGVATATSVNGLTITPSTGTITVPNGVTINAPEITTKIGFRHIPQNSQSAAYTTVLNDSGKHIYHPASDANARTFTIDSNVNVAYPIGTAITFVNLSANTVTIAITSDTLILAGTGTTGSRSLAQYGTATALKTNTTEWVVQGVGIS